MKRFILFLNLFMLYSFGLLSNDQPVVLVVGTRPEAIKVIPVYKALKEANIPAFLCCTGQHMELVDEILTLFQVEAGANFSIMKQGQDLTYLTETVLNKTTALLKDIKPSLVVVQGDTTSAMAAALAAFYCKIPVAHIEAGLRTHNIYAPFPEEMNRQLITRLSSLHFTPTAFASSQLKLEGVADDKIYETGNTVVDALYMIRDKIEKKEILPSQKIDKIIQDLKANGQSIFLLTAHRRESLQSGMEEAMRAIYSYLKTHPNMTIVYPIHPNPLIAEILKKTNLDSLPNLILLPPLCYNDMVYLLLQCKGVLTDSGGIQEEAVSLNKPTLVLRNETDRPEGLQKGLAQLVGTDPDLISKGIESILYPSSDQLDDQGVSPYGDGYASQRIKHIIQQFLSNPSL